jgi:methylated-DNA-protein-cysteine methyltransferase related protein
MPQPREPSAFALAVMKLVEQVPAGRVLTYGDVAELVGSRSPRAVGAVMATWGHELEWQRVVLSDGSPAPGHEKEALRRLRRDGCPLTRAGSRVDLARARWVGPP